MSFLLPVYSPFTSGFAKKYAYSLSLVLGWKYHSGYILILLMSVPLYKNFFFFLVEWKSLSNGTLRSSILIHYLLQHWSFQNVTLESFILSFIFMDNLDNTHYNHIYSYILVKTINVYCIYNIVECLEFCVLFLFLHKLADGMWKPELDCVGFSYSGKTWLYKTKWNTPSMLWKSKLSEYSFFIIYWVLCG